MGKSSPTPDNSGVAQAQASAQAATQEYQLGEQQLAFSQQQWAQDQPIIQQVANADTAAQTAQANFSNTLEGSYTGTTLPLEQQYAQQAQNWDTPAQEQLNSGAAQAAAGNQIDSSRTAAMSQLEQYGVDPSSTRYAALDIGTGVQKGAAEAAAGTTAIQNTKLQGMGLEQNAILAGQGVANTGVSASGVSTGAGTSASGSTTSGLNAATTAMTSPTAYYNSGAANEGVYTNAVNGFNYAQNQAAQISNQASAGFGSLAGGIFGSLMPTNGIMGFEDGGAIPDGSQPAPQQGGAGSTPGGVVPTGASPSQGGTPDDVPARLTAGEFVIPTDVVKWEGEKNMYAIIDKARQAKQKASQRPDVGGQPGAPLPGPPSFTSRPQLPVQQTSGPGVLPAALH